MSKIELNRLRALKRKAELLLSTLASDLVPFKHQTEPNGFRRKPDSVSNHDDVNITTTCSCLMGLANSGKLITVYGSTFKTQLEELFSKLVAAPWMSSGLTENNAFTTTLIIRLLGYLVGAKVVTNEHATRKSKTWEPKIPFANFGAFVSRLVAAKRPFDLYLFQRFTPALQLQIQEFVKGNKDALTQREVDIQLVHLFRTSSFSEYTLLEGIDIQPETQSLLNGPLDGYKIAQLNRFLLHDAFSIEIRPLKPKSLQEIAYELSEDIEQFGINGYSPAAAVLYWFVEGVVHANITLPKEHWSRLCEFAAREFSRQRSLARANHAAMMDPVAMAMAACLCARLRSLSNKLGLGTNNEHHATLPSGVELESSVLELFEDQTDSGIWPKYFPLFHYQEAGSNFCFTFEMLEAVLLEFGGIESRLLTNDIAVTGLERAVTWCERNRLQCSVLTDKKLTIYEGWNSGGDINALRKGQPESWATAVIHMFLQQLINVLARHVQERLLQDYAASKPSAKWKTTIEMLDIPLWLNPSAIGLKKILAETILHTFKDFKGQDAERLRMDPIKKKPLSALLFGPPGTSKTEVAKAIAKELQWPLLEIDPSHFLQNSFQNIYVQAEKIFDAVMDLCGVVVLFDEMDALVQRRDSETGSDIESKFLTTYMLPKLAKLHDRGQVVFLMATNFQATFDDAIKRAGRFDYLLCMGPPTFEDKCKFLDVFLEEDNNMQNARDFIRNVGHADPWIEDQLALYTYGEFNSFMSNFKTPTALVEEGVEAFINRVRQDSQTVSLKLDDLEHLRRIPKFPKWTRLAELDKHDFDERSVIEATIDSKIPAIKYVLERKQSRKQC